MPTLDLQVNSSQAIAGLSSFEAAAKSALKVGERLGKNIRLDIQAGNGIGPIRNLAQLFDRLPESRSIRVDTGDSATRVGLLTNQVRLLDQAIRRIQPPVRLAIDTGASGAALASLDRRLESLSSRMSSIGANSSRMDIGVSGADTRGIEDAAGGLDSLGTNLLRLAGITAGGFSLMRIFDTINLASTARETVAQFEWLYDEVLASADSFADDLAKNYGQTKTSSRAMLTGMGDLFVAMNMSQKTALDLSHGLAKLSVDIGSYKNLQPEQAVNAFTSALMGNSTALKSLGIDISDETTKAEMLRQKQQGLRFESERVAKAYAIFELASKQSQKAIGDFSKESGGFANQMRKLELNTVDLGEKIGAALLPAMTQLVTVANFGIEKITGMDDSAFQLTVQIATVTTGVIALTAAIRAMNSAASMAGLQRLFANLPLGRLLGMGGAARVAAPAAVSTASAALSGASTAGTVAPASIRAASTSAGIFSRLGTLVTGLTTRFTGLGSTLTGILARATGVAFAVAKVIDLGIGFIPKLFDKEMWIALDQKIMDGWAYIIEKVPKWIGSLGEAISAGLAKCLPNLTKLVHDLVGGGIDDENLRESERVVNRTLGKRTALGRTVQEAVDKNARLWGEENALGHRLSAAGYSKEAIAKMDDFTLDALESKLPDLKNLQKIETMFPTLMAKVTKDIGEADRSDRIANMSASERQMFFNKEFDVTDGMLQKLQGPGGAKFAGSLGVAAENLEKFTQSLLKRRNDALTQGRAADAAVKQEIDTRFGKLSEESQLAYLQKELASVTQRRDRAMVTMSEATARNVFGNTIRELEEKIKPLAASQSKLNESNAKDLFDAQLKGASFRDQRTLIRERMGNIHEKVQELNSRNALTVEERQQGMGWLKELSGLNDQLAGTFARIAQQPVLSTASEAVVAGTVQAREADAKIWQTQQKNMEQHAKETAKNTEQINRNLTNMTQKTIVIETPSK